jgi:putrescine transport system substrate-binding protein
MMQGQRLFARGAIASLCFAALTCLSGPAAWADDPTVNVYNWSDYIAPDTLEKFTKETGIKVNYDTYDGNETLEAKLAVGGSGYDIVVPTLSPFLARQIQAGYYQKLDIAKLPNHANLYPEMLERMAKLNNADQYAIPYAFSTIGPIYNVDMVKARMKDAPVDSLAIMFNPEILAKFKDCGVEVLDSPTEVLPGAMLYLGLDPTSQNPDDLKKAADHLIKLRPFIRKFHSSAYLNDLANGDACMVWGYTNDGRMSKRRAEQAGKGIHIEISIPKEGAEFFLDTMAIPKDAPHPELAYKFLNYIMRPEVAASLSNFLIVQTGNQAAEQQKLVMPAYLADKTIFLPPEIRSKLYLIPPPTPDYERKRTREWTRVKTNR